jgi:hypothetical protein
MAEREQGSAEEVPQAEGVTLMLHAYACDDSRYALTEKAERALDALEDANTEAS